LLGTWPRKLSATRGTGGAMTLTRTGIRGRTWRGIRNSPAPAACR